MEKARGILGAMLCCFRVGFCSAGKRCPVPSKRCGGSGGLFTGVCGRPSIGCVPR